MQMNIRIYGVPSFITMRQCAHWKLERWLSSGLYTVRVRIQKRRGQCPFVWTYCARWKEAVCRITTCCMSRAKCRRQLLGRDLDLAPSSSRLLLLLLLGLLNLGIWRETSRALPNIGAGYRRSVRQATQFDRAMQFIIAGRLFPVAAAAT